MSWSLCILTQIVADMFVACFFFLLRETDFQKATAIYKHMCHLFLTATKSPRFEIAKEFLEKHSKNILGDPGDPELYDDDFEGLDQDDIMMPLEGQRKGIRRESPYYKFFQSIKRNIEKEMPDPNLQEEENPFCNPDLVEEMTFQYLR